MGGPFGGSRHAPLGGSPFRGVLPVSLPEPLAMKNQAVADTLRESKVATLVVSPDETGAVGDIIAQPRQG